MSTNVSQLLKRIRKFIPPLDGSLHKGQSGRVAVIGGSESYTGAPYFSGQSSMLLGADLGHVICEPGASTVIKSYSPDLIVHPLMCESKRATADRPTSKIVEEIAAQLDRLHCIVVGPGLGRDPMMQDIAEGSIREARKREMPIVIDADGLFLVTNKPELVMGYEHAVLTPNIMEFKRLAEKMQVDMNGDATTLCAKLAEKLGGVTIIQKGQKDYISNGKETMVVENQGGYKRSGGQGDLLSGMTATMLAWKKCYEEGTWKHDNDLSGHEMTALAAFGAATLTRYCGRKAFEKRGRALQASDLIKEVGGAYVDLLDGDEPKVKL
ncbi:hypothetical protein YB2330_003294 [Saitoella coloradoensis]